MAYSEELAERIRDLTAAEPELAERKMFGGLCFMVNGNMCVGIVGDELMVRVGPDQHAAILAEPHVREMDFTGRPSRSMVFVEPAGIASDEDLDTWVRRALVFAHSLPPKAGVPPRRTKANAGGRSPKNRA
ncbi:MAG TPA: TfoX/Sxy family protein [Microthrixaceae bacterium]|nr:TfoX/Sxy family protein [Microthrixaceae bacterium]